MSKEAVRVGHPEDAACHKEDALAMMEMREPLNMKERMTPTRRVTQKARRSVGIGAQIYRFREWIPVIAWAAAIFWFSTDTFSGEHTRPLSSASCTH